MTRSKLPFYRKYRPQSLDELIGQSQVKQILTSSFQKGSLSHAYLLCGPKGTGKTSTARILAKMVNCERSTTKQKAESQKTESVNIPCNQCPTCLSITEGSNLDLMEIDAASNRGIDEVRALRENIKLTPSASRKKVYIIDEVHMLTQEAFNALLKTLEEPPPHAMFILATTEAHKVPPTVVSRVVRLDFKPASTEELIEALTKVASREKISIDQGAVVNLAKAAGGSFRDGEKLLEQLSSFEGKITQAVVAEILGQGQFEERVKLLEFIGERKSAAALSCLHQLLEQVAPQRLALLLLDDLRRLLLMSCGVEKEAIKEEMLEEEYEKLVKVLGRFDQGKIIRVIGLLSKSLEQGRFVSIVSLPLEVAVVESCLEEENGRGENSRVKNIPENTKSAKETVRSAMETPKVENGDEIKIIEQRWPYVLETIKPHNYSLGALLGSVKIIDFKEGKLRMEVPYSFHQRILEVPKNRTLLESVLSDAVGKAVEVVIFLGKREFKGEELANVEVASDDEIIRAAAEIFGAEQVN